MPVTLTVDANTYISLADAETYFLIWLYVSAWSSVIDDEKFKALIMVI